MKLSIALVAAALSLTACAEEPTTVGPSGIGPGKQFNTDPTLIDVEPIDGDRSSVVGDGYVETLSDQVSALHRIKDGVELIDYLDADGALLCHHAPVNDCTALQ